MVFPSFLACCCAVCSGVYGDPVHGFAWGRGWGGRGYPHVPGDPFGAAAAAAWRGLGPYPRQQYTVTPSPADLRDLGGLLVPGLGLDGTDLRGAAPAATAAEAPAAPADGADKAKRKKSKSGKDKGSKKSSKSGKGDKGSKKSGKSKKAK